MNGVKNCRAKSSSSGFTLIEIAAVLLVCSLLLVAAVSLIKTWMDQSTLAENQVRITTIQQALNTYAAQHSRLPCPANYTDKQSTLNFGRAMYTTAVPVFPYTCKTADNVNTFKNGLVFTGSVPVRDLGLPDSYIADTYGYRYTYATTQAGATNVTTANTISIKTTKLTGVSFPLATYVVVDHGPSGKGAYSIDGGLTSACPGGGTLDYYNCNHYASGNFEIEPFNNSIFALTNWFDDTVVTNNTSPTTNQACTVVGPVGPAGPPASTVGSSGLAMWGFDAGASNLLGFGLCGVVVCGTTGLYKDILNFGIGDRYGTFSKTSPAAADANCKDATYTVVTGGCTQTSTKAFPPLPSDWWVIPNGVIYRADLILNPLESLGIPGNTGGVQPIMPPLSHPIENAGIQGWECNGSSAYGMKTYAYAVCCTQGN